MKNVIFLFSVLLLFLSCSTSEKPVVQTKSETPNLEDKPLPSPFQENKEDINVLVFTKTNEFVHDNIKLGCGIMYKMGTEKGWKISFSEDSLLIRPERLKRADVLVFFNTTGDILGKEQQDAVEEFVKGGGGFLGIHSAADTEYDWPFYHDLVGAYFKNHPGNPGVRKASCMANAEHPIHADIPNPWTREDEWYNFKDIKDHIIPLYNLDESTYEGGEHGDNHPIAWYHNKFKGKAVYTAMGHTKESFSDENFLKFIENSIVWLAN